MTVVEIALVAGIVYVILDFVLSLTLGRCVLPGLKCRVCRERIWK